MRLLTAIALVAAVTAAPACVQLAPRSAQKGAAPTNSALYQTIAELDRKLFAAFNACDGETMRGLMAPDLEFYQDNDNSTFTRDELEKSQRLRCAGGTSRVVRESGAFTVYPLKDFGAVQVGVHAFYPMEGGIKGALDSSPQFVHVWRNDRGTWTLTRVVSYGH